MFLHPGADPGDHAPIGSPHLRVGPQEMTLGLIRLTYRRVVEIHQIDLRQLAAQVRNNLNMLFGHQLRRASDHPWIRELAERAAPGWQTSREMTIIWTLLNVLCNVSFCKSCGCFDRNWDIPPKNGGGGGFSVFRLFLYLARRPGFGGFLKSLFSNF